MMSGIRSEGRGVAELSAIESPPNWLEGEDWLDDGTASPLCRPLSSVVSSVVIVPDTQVALNRSRKGVAKLATSQSAQNVIRAHPQSSHSGLIGRRGLRGPCVGHCHHRTPQNVPGTCPRRLEIGL